MQLFQFAGKSTALLADFQLEYCKRIARVDNIYGIQCDEQVFTCYCYGITVFMNCMNSVELYMIYLIGLCEDLAIKDVWILKREVFVSQQKIF